MTDPLSTCPDCAAPLPPDSPQALCPACLMRQALASRTIDDGSHPAPTSPPLTPEELGEKFPSYEILQCLGRGGMGVVYKARQKSLNRIVAIKILAPERGSESRFAERFAREAELLAKLNHPHIVTIHDFGETGGLFYLVMEFVDGVNLRDLLRDGKLEQKQALAIVPPICDALQYAHDKGIVHRDIKPENLLLDREGRIKIADFGIASLMGAAGEIAGTPPYMAPEQTGGDIDHRADIYALGVVLYEMLTGERPGKELIAPSRKVQIDVRLDEMVLRALEQDPERRYQTAGEFKTLVETMKPDPAAKPPAPPVPVRPPGMFQRWWWILLLMIPGGMILGLSAGAVFSYLAPKKYEAFAVIEMKPETGNPLEVGPEFFGSAYAELTSDANLRLVSQQLDLSNRWMLKEHEVPGALNGIITVQNIRGTDLVEIRVRHTDPQDAVDVANAIAMTPAAGAPFQTVVHEPATRPKTPVSPNVRLVLAIGAGGGLLLSPVFALVCMLVLHRLFPWRPDGASTGKPVSNRASVEKWAIILFIGAIVGFPVLWGFLGAQEVIALCGLALLLAFVLGLMSWRSQSGKFAALASGVGLLLLVAFTFYYLSPRPSSGSNDGVDQTNAPLPKPKARDATLMEQPEFGPTIERLIPRLAAEEACLLDLDTGEFKTPPGDLVEQLKLNTTEKTDLKKSSLKWLRESGVDIAASPDSDTIYVIGSLTKGHHPPFVFNDMTPDLVADMLLKPASIPKHKPDIYSAILPADLGPMVYITSEGTKGVMEIPSGTNDPAGVKIRYKLLRGSNPSAEAMAAAKAVLDLPPLEAVKELKIPLQDFPEGAGREGYRLTVAPGKGAYVLATLREFEGTEVIGEKTPAKRQVARLQRTQSVTHSEDVFLDSFRDDVKAGIAATARFSVSGFGQQVVISGLDIAVGGGLIVGGEDPIAVTRRFKFTDPGGDKARTRIVEFALRVINEDDAVALAKRRGFSLPDENVADWAITLAEPPAEPAMPDTSAVDGPWGNHFKEGEIRRAQEGLDDALNSYRRSLEAAQNELKQHPHDAAWHAYSQRRIKKSYTRIGDVLCAQGDLAGALENYRTGLAGFEPLVRKETADEELRNELTALYVKIGDVLEAQGNKAGALAAFRKAQEVDFPDFRTWEEEFIKSIGGNYYPTKPFNPEELRQLAAKPLNEDDNRDLAELICRAGAEKDVGFRYLLDMPDLRKDEEVNLALIAYDYSVNGNPKALDDLLARLAKEKTGSDSSVAATLAFVDEWDRVPRAMNAHFAEADGSGGELRGFCKAWSAYLFPRNSLKHEGKAGEGAPVKLR